MNAEQFCAEYAHETKRGAISFSKRIVDKFIKTYTHLDPNDFTDKMRERLKISVMINLYNDGINMKSHFNNSIDQPIEKIELPEFIFK